MTTYNFLVKCQTRVVVNGVGQRLNAGDLLVVDNEQDAQQFIAQRAEGSEHLVLTSVSKNEDKSLEPTEPLVGVEPGQEANDVKVVPAVEINEVPSTTQPVELQVEIEPEEPKPTPKKRRTTPSAE